MNIPVNHRVCGKCSLCGGLVTVLNVWGPSEAPQCMSCGATGRAHKTHDLFDFLPEVDMVPPGKTQLNG